MLPELQAQQQLAAIEAAAIPHMKPDAQRDTIRRYQAHVRMDVAKPGPGDLAALGIHVRKG